MENYRADISSSTAGDKTRVPSAELRVVVGERHVHLSEPVIEQLFCDHYRLHVEFEVSQPPQFAAREMVALVGPRGRIPEVRVIGPARAVNQIEISQSDAQMLGIPAPLRASGDLHDTPGIMLEGPRASVRLDRGVIRSLRHIHLSPSEADRHGLKDGDRIDVARADPLDGMLFRDVLVRVGATFRSELHLDADDGRAAGLHSGAHVAIKAKEPV